MNADGSGATQVTSEPTGADDPAWWPDGTRIAFNRNGGNELAAVDLVRGAVTTVTTSGGTELEPAVSPDGGRIAFSSNRNTWAEIWVKDLSSGAESRLTAVGGGAGQSGARFPNWAPDGSMLAYSAAGDTNQVFTMNADGTQKTQVTTSPLAFPGASSSNPAWSR